MTLWLGDPVLLGICLSLSHFWVGQMWQSGCLWVSRQRELLERQRESPLELSSYEYVVHHNESIPTSPSPSSTCIMKFCPSSLYRYLYLSISLHVCHHPSPRGLHLPPVSAAVARQYPQGGGPGKHCVPGWSAGVLWGGPGDLGEAPIEPPPLHKALLLSAAFHLLDSSSPFAFRLDPPFLGGFFLISLKLSWQMALLTSSLAPLY